MKLTVKTDGMKTQITDDQGRNLGGMVTSLSFRHEAGDAPTMDLRLILIDLEAAMEARIVAPNPDKDGAMTRVAKIVWEDGTETVFA